MVGLFVADGADASTDSGWLDLSRRARDQPIRRLARPRMAPVHFLVWLEVRVRVLAKKRGRRTGTAYRTSNRFRLAHNTPFVYFNLTPVHVSDTNGIFC